MASLTLRRFAKQWLLPPALTEFLRGLRRPQKHVDFQTFWNRFPKSSVPTELSDMVSTFVESPDFKNISRYWHHLNAINLEMIARDGADNYRKNVSFNYYTWTEIDEDKAGSLFRIAGSAQSPYRELFRQQPGLAATLSVQHNILIAALYAAVMARPVARYFAQVRERVTDSTPHLMIDGKPVTQDRLNSLLEFERISLLGDFADRTILEIGAGDGRTAACMMSLIPSVKYIIADIPPAVFLCSQNLRRLFPDRRITMAFTASSQLSALIRDNDLIFIFPHQLRLLANKSIDLFLAVDCLHEMTKTTINDYFAQIDRLATTFYMKVWSSTQVPLDLHRLTRDDYPVRAHWKKVFDESCVFPSNFSEMGYRLAHHFSP
jgi:putative sugar O-methyltransferase